MEFSSVTFTQIKTDAEVFYASIGHVRCPYFGEDVHFNAKGWNHLVSKVWNKRRIAGDQFGRFRHIKLGPEIIRQSHTVQGVWNTKKIERVKINNRWEKVLKNVTYYEFIAVMESHGSKVRIKIVVKEIEGGEKFFWTLMPFWRSDTSTGRRIMHAGNPEDD